MYKSVNSKILEKRYLKTFLLYFSQFLNEIYTMSIIFPTRLK